MMGASFLDNTDVAVVDRVSLLVDIHNLEAWRQDAADRQLMDLDVHRDATHPLCLGNCGIDVVHNLEV